MKNRVVWPGPKSEMHGAVEKQQLGSSTGYLLLPSLIVGVPFQSHTWSFHILGTPLLISVLHIYSIVSIKQ